METILVTSENDVLQERNLINPYPAMFDVNGDDKRELITNRIPKGNTLTVGYLLTGRSGADSLTEEQKRDIAKYLCDIIEEKKVLKINESQNVELTPEPKQVPLEPKQQLTLETNPQIIVKNISTKDTNSVKTLRVVREQVNPEQVNTEKKKTEREKEKDHKADFLCEKMTYDSNENLTSWGAIREASMGWLEEAVNTQTHGEVIKPLLLLGSHPYEGNRHKTGVLYDINTKIYYTWNRDEKIWEEFKILGMKSDAGGNNLIGQHINILILCLGRTTSKLLEMLSLAEKDADKENIRITIRKIRTLVNKLGDCTFIEKLEKLVNRKIGCNFEEMRDKLIPGKKTTGEPTEWIPMNNKYNLNIRTHEQRMRCVDDYHTFTLNAHYDKYITTIKPERKKDKAELRFNDDEYEQYEISHEAHKLVYDFLSKISLEDDEMTKFLVIVLGVYMSCYMYDKTFLILMGDGSNGKSVLSNILHELLGGYCVTIDNKIIFGTTNNNESANHHDGGYTSLINTRLWIAGEPPAGAKPKMDFIKKQSGYDPFPLRAFGAKKKVDYHLPAHLIICANGNDLYGIDDKDDATRDRPIVFTMSAKFEKELPANYDPSNPEGVYLQDPDIVKKITKTPRCMDALFTIFMLGCKEFLDKGGKKYDKPAKVIEATEAFLGKSKSSCKYNDFIEDMCETYIELKEKPAAFGVTQREIYLVYQAYCHNNDINPDNNDTFKKELSNHYQYKPRNYYHIDEKGMRKRSKTGDQYNGLQLKSSDERKTIQEKIDNSRFKAGIITCQQ
jgi:phage/plasmid-associated DNA primase